MESTEKEPTLTAPVFLAPPDRRYCEYRWSLRSGQVLTCAREVHDECESHWDEDEDLHFGENEMEEPR